LKTNDKPENLNIEMQKSKLIEAGFPVQAEREVGTKKGKQEE